MMNFFTYLAIRSTDNVCLGPFCDDLKNSNNSNIVVLVGLTLSKFINMILIVGSLFLVVFLLWGAFDWIVSEGDKEKLQKARQKLTNAVIGMILMVVALTIFMVVSGDILGIVKRNSQGTWTFELPQINP